MKRMDASGYAACFDHQQLALMCANSDRTIERLGAENKQLKAENAKLRELVGGLRYCANESHGRCAIHAIGSSDLYASCCPLYDTSSGTARCESLMRSLGIEVDNGTE